MRAPGARLGPYEILAPLGSGGMGEVYRARDTKLHRDVALKILPDAFASDSDRVARFTREAQALAALNHPHIAQIYGLEQSSTPSALVMELVEGEDLAQRIARGAIPITEALAIAKQIADGLEAAHEKGIIHRDLKPANIKLTPDGTVKVLDFGLAKAAAPARYGDAANSPTFTAAATQLGVIVGTAAYMAPEQARGRTVDKRADIWAFGCVLYEMLTGIQAFGGENITDIVAAVVTREPDWAALPREAPAHVRALLRRCLVKDPRQRLRDIGDARLELEAGRGATTDESAGAPDRAGALRRSRMFVRAVLPIAALALGLFLGTMAEPLRRAPTAARLDAAFGVPPPGGSTFATSPSSGGIVSPDGRQLVFIATRDRVQRIWLRPMDSVTARPLDGTEGAVQPFWSPDGAAIGFFADRKLKRVGVSGGAPQTLCDAPDPAGGTWNANDVILFARVSSGDGLYRVPATGGEPQRVTSLATGRLEVAQRWPHFLPDGRRFLYLSVISTGHEKNGIHAGSLDGADPKLILPSNSRAVYAPPGYLLFVRDRALIAQRMDGDRLALTGEPIRIAEPVGWNQVTNEAGFSASATGVLTYWIGGGQPRSELVWFTRNGTRAGTLGGMSYYDSPDISPDGRRVAISRYDASTHNDVWMLDLERGTETRITSGPADESLPIWSPTSDRILFNMNAEGPEDLFVKDASGAGEPEPIHRSDVTHKHPHDWSPDGRFVIYSSRGPTAASNDLLLLPMTGERQPITLVRSDFSEVHGQFSPDSRWVAYSSIESGTPQVYVRPVDPHARGRVQISGAGGMQPRWRGQGGELFYLAPDGRLMGVSIESAGQFRAGRPTILFDTGTRPAWVAATDYDVMPDGQRFLVRVAVENVEALPFTVVLNWIRLVN